MSNLPLCLRCRKPFKFRSKYNKICDKCNSRYLGLPYRAQIAPARVPFTVSGIDARGDQVVVRYDDEKGVMLNDR